MSTAVAESVSVSSSPLPFLLRRLHSLTGLLFGSYLVIHLMINATLIEGKRHGMDVFAEQVQKIHGLPFLLAIEWVMIYLPILFHGVFGIWVAVAGQPNAINYPYRNNWYYVLQRLSTIIIVLFMAFHIFGFKGCFGPALAFDPALTQATASVKHHFAFHWSLLYVVYPLGVLASTFHTANGFRGAAMAWGLTVSKRSMARWDLVCTAIFVGMTICGFVALAAIAGMDVVK